MALARLDLVSHLMLNNPTQLQRDEKGHVIDVNGEGGVLQSLFHIEVDRLTSKEEMQALKAELLDILSDTRLVVSDWKRWSTS